MENKIIKILAIDDKNDNLISLKALIKEAFPDSIRLTASNGAAGIELARAEDPDVILLDVVMPGMDGYEVCQKLKANPESSNIPVVFVTALKGDKQSCIRALEVGAEAFLAKPIDEAELTAQVRAMLKIKVANDQKQNEKERLDQLVKSQTRELEQNYTASLNLLGDLQEENEARKRSEASLQESEERFRRAIISAPIPIIIHAEDGQVITINTPWTQLTGYDHSDIPTITDWTRKAYGNQMDIVREDIVNLYALDGPKAGGEYTITTSSGEQRIWDFSSAPIGQLPDGRRLVISMAMDVTERKQREQEIKTRNEELSALYSLSRLLADAQDLENVIKLVNHHAAESLQTTFASIALLDNDKLVMRGIYPVRELPQDTIVVTPQPYADFPNIMSTLEKNEPVILQAKKSKINSSE
jgi:PAS domain S-box-containing protein